MSKKAKNLTLNSKILKLASQLMEALGEESMSNFIEGLIRNEYERRNGLIKINSLPRDVDTTGTESTAVKRGLEIGVEGERPGAKERQSSPGAQPRARGRRGLGEG